MWYGYKHINGTIHLKRWFSVADIEEAQESDFVDEIYGPWNVSSRKEAASKLAKEIHAERDDGDPRLDGETI